MVLKVVAHARFGSPAAGCRCGWTGYESCNFRWQGVGTMKRKVHGEVHVGIGFRNELLGWMSSSVDNKILGNEVTILALREQYKYCLVIKERIMSPTRFCADDGIRHCRMNTRAEARERREAIGNRGVIRNPCKFRFM